MLNILVGGKEKQIFENNVHCTAGLILEQVVDN